MTFLLGSTTFRTLRTSARSIRNSPTVSHRSFHSSPRISAIYSNANTETIEKVIKESQNRVVLVDFYAELRGWCQPCRLFSPILEKFASEPNTSANGLPVDLVKVDTESDQGQQLAIKHQISSLPTVYVYKDGEAVTHFVGALPEPHLKQVLDRL